MALRDVIAAVARGETLRLSGLLQRAFFVPETIRISQLLRQLQQSGHGIAMVVDEYGSVAGLVTVQDVLEEIVGEIREQGERRAELVIAGDDGSVVLDGITPIDAAERHLGVSLPHSREYSTIAGLLLAAFDAVPTPGASVEIAGRRWTAQEMEGARIRRVSVRPV